MANINLLPWREELREKRKKDYIGILGLVFFGAVALVYVSVHIIEMMSNNQRERNAFLQSEVTILNKQISEIKNVKQRRKDIERRTDIILNLQESRNLPTQVLNELVRVVPTGMYLSSVNKKGNMLRVDGRSESNNHVANLMRRVESSVWLQQPSLESIISQNESSRQLQRFNLSIVVKPRPLLKDSLAALKETKS